MSKITGREQLAYYFMLIWLGGIIGLSFIATPAKFLVPELELVTAIKIGRATFQLFFYFECVMMAAVTFALIFKTHRFSLITLWLLLVLFCFQQWVVLPEVQTATDYLLSSNVSRSGTPHFLFIALESLKAALLALYLPCLKYFLNQS